MTKLLPFLIAVGSICIVAGSSRGQTIDVDSALIRVIDEVEVPSRATGALATLRMREGDVVKTGDLLALIDDTEAKLAMQRAEYELEIAKHLAGDDVSIRSAVKQQRFAVADYERRAKARRAEPRSISESELERARLESEQAQLEIEKAESELRAATIRQRLASSDLEMARRNLEIRRITAPIDGVVVEAKRKVGEWLQPGEMIFRIVRTDRLRAEGFVRASDAVRGLQGCTATLVPLDETLTRNAVGATKHTGTITFVSPEIDPVNGQVRVWADFDNAEGLLRPGLRAKMTIQTGRAARVPEGNREFK